MALTQEQKERLLHLALRANNLPGSFQCERGCRKFCGGGNDLGGNISDIVRQDGEGELAVPERAEGCLNVDELGFIANGALVILGRKPLF